MKSIKISDLEIGFHKTLEAIKELHGTEIQVDLDEDYYWNIDDDELYKVEKQPGRMDIGSLYSDLEQLEKIIKDEIQPVPYNIKLFSSMLRFISAKL